RRGWRGGPPGSVALNRRIAPAVRRRARGAPATLASPFAQWYPGRLVLVTANRPALGLFNGDVGVCVPRPGAAEDRRQDAHESADGGAHGDLVVAFADVDGARLVPVAQMPPCEDARARTGHKAQGAEFEARARVPPPRGPP